MAYGTIIIGNGIAGITAARQLRKLSKERIQIISSETPYFFSRTALMYVYMGHMKFEHTQPYENWFWEKNNIELVHSKVVKVDTQNKKIHLSSGEELCFSKLLIASGSSTKYYGWKGQHLKGVQGLYSYQDLMELEQNTPAPFQKNHPTKTAIIVGAGLIGVELAEMLSTRHIKVIFLIRENAFWGNVLTANESERIGNHLVSHNIDLKNHTELDEVLKDSQGRVRGIRTKSGEELESQLVGIATGVAPNVKFLEGSGLEIDKGILVNDKLETNVPNIYAAGDCAQVREAVEGRKPIEAVWYVGRMMGEVAGSNLANKNVNYRPGPWFNSAKFFDIEYQTYGSVLAKPEGIQKQFFWEANDVNKFITVAYHPETFDFMGINTFGIRLKHEYFDNVLRKKMKVGEVMGGIKAANFDPEFYKQWYKKLLSDFSAETGIVIQKPTRLKQLLQR